MPPMAYISMDSLKSIFKAVKTPTSSVNYAKFFLFKVIKIKKHIRCHHHHNI